MGQVLQYKQTLPRSAKVVQQSTMPLPHIMYTFLFCDECLHSACDYCWEVLRSMQETTSVPDRQSFPSSAERTAGRA
jgi:hypothetical protein